MAVEAIAQCAEETVIPSSGSTDNNGHNGHDNVTTVITLQW